MHNQRSNQIAGSAQSAHIEGLLELLAMVAEKSCHIAMPLRHPLVASVQVAVD